MKKRVVLGLSGGVDSSVAAYLLKEQGYDVFGLFMINWHDATGTLSGDCPWGDDLVFAELAARKLGIGFDTVDLSDEYRKRVVDYMFSEYQKGRTPNPDILCNREIKFDLFIESALKYNADFVATGHYCMKDHLISKGININRLLEGKDPNKDQSYFLCQLSQKQLDKALFPIGGLHKHEVRNIADQQNLPAANKKDSQGLCFIGKIDLPTFLQQKLEPRKGRIIEIPKKSEVFRYTHKFDYKSELSSEDLKNLAAPFKYTPENGENTGLHNGAHFYTIGQRKGLNIGGKSEPLFVIGTDIEKNLLYVGQGQNHPGLFRQGLFIPEQEIHWVREDLALKTGESKEFLVRIRYRQALQRAALFQTKEGIYIIFKNLQRGITPGQFAAWYTDNEVIGSGPIYL